MAKVDELKIVVKVKASAHPELYNEMTSVDAYARAERLRSLAMAEARRMIAGYPAAGEGNGQGSAATKTAESTTACEDESEKKEKDPHAEFRNQALASIQSQF